MLCINQVNVSERNHQVTMMKEIFQRASLAVVWLGSDSGREAVEGANPMLHVPLPYTAWSHPEDDHVDHGLWKVKPETLHQARALLSRPYWRRVWIIQELCVAKNVLIMYGTHFLPWSAFASALTQPSRPTPGVPAAIFTHAVGQYSVPDFRLLIPYNLVDLRRRFQNGVGAISLGSLLTFSSQSEATDPRDRVYCLLGLTGNGAHEKVVTDYSLSPCDVYCSTIRVLYESFPGGGMQATSQSSDNEVRGIIQKCSHDPLVGETERRRQCDCLECGAWWCCLDLALFIS